MLRFEISSGFLIVLLASVSPKKNWDLNHPCKIYLEKLATAQSKMAYCAIIHSTPPKVCTNCVNEYLNFKQMEYFTHHLDNVFSVDNKTCSAVIYDNYLLSYGNEFANFLTDKLWIDSRCKSCLVINWDFKRMNSTISYDNNTLEFQKVLYDWRDCVTNVLPMSINSTVCTQCEKPFNKLFDYYWKIYTNPAVDFCLDVETTMNDTMNVWHNVWMCPDNKTMNRYNDVTVAVFSVTILVIVIAFFYAGSYIQTDNEQTHLIRYSHLVAPSSRYRLLSSSTDLHNLNIQSESLSVHE